MIVAMSILDLIGKTPMVRINKLREKGFANILAKLESYNIGGSIKDRMALFLMAKAEEEGKLSDGRRIIEATSGNTGIALAMISAVKGYKITIVMSESASIERRKLIRAYGAELVLSPAEGTGGAIELKKKLIDENPSKYVALDQFNDTENIRAHYETTGKEIIEQTEGRFDAVIVGVGTAGTGVGISMAVKEHNPKIKIIGVVPKLGVRIPGLRNPKDSNPSQLFSEGHFDEIIELTENEVADTFETARRMAREEGLLVGMSSAAIIHVALRKARELGEGKTVVVILPDNADKYLSTGLFE
jgi:cysteine synthase